jgi:mannitol-1-/sugar-/sorbitol-6-phosphatase
VLVESTACVERQWALFAAEHGLPLAKVLEVAHGRPTIETVRLAVPHLSAAAATATAELLEEREARDFEGVLEVTGASRLLHRLPEARWAIVTSGTRLLATARLAHVGLAVPRVLVTADDIVRGKPDPEPYLLGARRLGVVPSACVVVEDAPAGIRAARAAGMYSIAVTTSHREEQLREADLVVPGLADVEERLVAAVLAGAPA